MIYPKIYRVETVSDRTLRVEFTNQIIKAYDIDISEYELWKNGTAL